MSTKLAGLELSPTVTVGTNTYGIEPLITADEIQGRVDVMGRGLAERFTPRGEVHVLTVMNGALHFASDLRRSMQRAAPDLKMTSDQIQVSSYTGTQSSGMLRPHNLSVDVAGRDVLLVEDIYDSGLTLKWLTNYFRAQEPASLEVAVAVSKKNPTRPSDLLAGTKVHVGFEIADEFVVGYGLDINQQLRDLDGIHVLSPVLPTE